jgi:archaellum biogenesis protein FlaJ (TadC family)
MDKLTLTLTATTTITLTLTILLTLQANYTAAIATATITASTTIILLTRKTAGPGQLNIKLVLAITHMYTLSLGLTEPREIIESIAKKEEYREYRETFKNIINLAINMSLGLTKAIAQAAKTVKPPLKDILTRMAEALSTTKPKDYLELEHTTIMEEYMGQQGRSLETIRMLSGVYGTFQSIAAVIIIIVIAMSLFTINPNTITLAYIAAAASTATLTIALWSTAPKDIMMYLEKDHPTHKTIKIAAAITIPASITIAITTYTATHIPPRAITSSSLTLLPLGILTRNLEKRVQTIDEYYPTLIKTLGENLATTLNPKAALEYTKNIHLGPLKNGIQHAISWINLGLDIEKSFKLMAEETGSHTIRIMNQMLVDSIRVGAPPIQTSKTIADTTIKILEMRKRRLTTAKTMDTIIMMMHPITIILLIAVTNTLTQFTSIIPTLPIQYIPINTIPTQTITIANMIFTYIISTINAAAMTIVRGGYKWRITLNTSILLTVGGISWAAAEIFTNTITKLTPII